MNIEFARRLPKKKSHPEYMNMQGGFFWLETDNMQSQVESPICDLSFKYVDVVWWQINSTMIIPSLNKLYKRSWTGHIREII